MTTLQTNSNNDIFVKNGSIPIPTDLVAIMQVCEQTIKTQVGELVLQTDVGIPTFATIWGGTPNIAQAEAAIRSSLLKVNGVLEVTELKAIVSNNVFSYNVKIKSIFGEAYLNGL